MSYLREQLRELVDEFWMAEFRHHQGLSTKAAAELLGIHEQTLRAHARQGRVRVYGTPGSFRFKVPDLIKYSRNGN